MLLNNSMQKRVRSAPLLSSIFLTYINRIYIENSAQKITMFPFHELAIGSIWLDPQQFVPTEEYDKVQKLTRKQI